MLDDALKSQLKGYLEKVVRPIEIRAAVDASAKSIEMVSLLTDITNLSDKITLVEEQNSPDRTPSFALTTPGQEISLRFAGIPLGHEFTSLVLALLQVGGHPPRVEQAVIDQIRALDGDFSFETYFSLSCQNCPDVVQALNLMAVLNPRIKHVAIDGGVFPEEVEARQIMSVPTVYLNGDVFGQGRMDAEQILAKLDTGAAARSAEKIKAQEPFEVLVVGGGPAGAAAAIYAARKGIRTGIATERFGGQVLDTAAIENFISVRHTEGPHLAAALEEHVKEYDVEIMNLQRAEKIVRKGEYLEVELANGAALKSKSVILATGARWRQLGVPGEMEYRNKGVTYCPHCDGPLFKGKRVAVIGGGNSGVEAAIDLAGIVDHVTLLELDFKLRADEVLQRKLRSLPNVDIITGAKTAKVEGDGQKVVGIAYESRSTSDKRVLPVDGIFIQIGLLPNTEWLKGALELTPHGEIVVDSHNRSSMPGVFAAGDCTTTPYKQIVIALGEGAKASLAAFDHLIRISAPDEKEVKAA
ncbi:MULTISPECIES: alkyl hydroperoxide reductase subunit F [unclassified Hyphomicrobium]|uniref:alkyl hydroperoxide reductase subunit F n=1 Tax=unclassified Hyphomicrobium TaxID=2619925 RepID=UPI000213D40D|nr:MULTISPECIES: alkyl hydroperoxide reductase subunit F [unclassified Hyphomicrobium]CCB68061.1 Alkyl hydroperoxide reductase subunit F (Alkyl hydroperoxide reductase F52A protein) [Hyphomicrobium sp. MC1]